MKLTILGSYSATPHVDKAPTAQLLEIRGHRFLIDCGEGTQVRLRQHKVKFSHIKHIFISHLHGDHFYGLPGLISTFRLLGRQAPLHIYGPKWIKEAILLLLKLADSWTNYPLRFHELDDQDSRKHFNDLGGKDYPSLYGINSPDHVLMYVPIEPALMLALQEEKAIYLDALDKNVVLVSTSTLLATLSTIASIWKQEDQKRNVLEIAKEGGLLYDKFESFVSDLIKIGRSLQTSQESYQDAMNKLVEGRGNIVKKVENLKKLGAKTKKSLPQNIIDRSSGELES